MEKSITIWVGLDVHKNSIAAHWLRGDAEIGEECSIPNEERPIRKLVKRLKKLGDLRCCYEAGPCGYELRRFLAKLDVACEVIAPSETPRKGSDRVKTDRRDAKKLARYYRGGDLTIIRVPTELEEAVRDLVRCREDAREEGQRARHHVLKFLLRHGRVFRETRHWTVPHWAWLRAQSFEHYAAQRTYNDYIAHLQAACARLSDLDKELSSIANEEPWCSMVGRLRCLRGIDVLSALMIIVEIQDFRRFKSPRDLMSFVGLVPSVHQSGDSRGRPGSITKSGNGHVRRVLVEAAWHYRHKNKPSFVLQKRWKTQPAEVQAESRKALNRLTLKYHHLVARGKPTPMAATAVARELVGFIWALAVKHEQPNATTVKPARPYVIKTRQYAGVVAKA